MKKSFYSFITLILGIIFLLAPISALAIGQTTEPILIKNAVRGQSYDRTVIIVNTEKSKQTVGLGAEGSIGEWVKFYENSKATENIDKVEMAAGAKKTVIARFTVPTSTPNGKYEGFVSVKTIPNEGELKEGESGSTVAQKIDREATVEVGGEEIVDFDVSLISDKFDYNRGDLLKIRIIYDNRGNVSITPQIDFKIKQNDDVFYSAIFPFPENQSPVIPGTVTEISALEIPTSSLQNGKYNAVFKITQGEKVVEKEFTFSVGLVKSESSVKINTQSINGFKDILYFAGLILLVSGILYFGIKRNQKKKAK